MTVALGDSLVTQTVKNLPAMQKTWVRSLAWEESLEEGMANHPSILSWRIAMDREARRATAHGVTKGRTRLSFTSLHFCWERGYFWSFAATDSTEKMNIAAPKSFHTCAVASDG